MKKLSLLLFLIGFLLFTNPAFAALTKTSTQVDQWYNVPQNTITVNTVLNVSGNYQTVLQVDAALIGSGSSTNGFVMLVQTSSSQAGDTHWADAANLGFFGSLYMSSSTITANAVVGSNSLTLYTMVGFSSLGSLCYAGSIGNSELVRIVATSGTSVRLLQPLTIQQNKNTQFHNTASSIIVNIPDSVSRVRTICDNTKDPVGFAVDARIQANALTGI